MLAHRLQRRANNKTALGQRLLLNVFGAQVGGNVYTKADGVYVTQA